MAPTTPDFFRNLTSSADGIWTSAGKDPISYPPGGHSQCFEVEDRSFWFKHRNDCIVTAIRQYPPAGTILDIGGGNGFVTRRLIDEGFDAMLLEPGPTGALNAKRCRQIPDVICATLEEMTLQPGSLRAAGVFDVLEHIEDDHRFVDHLHGVMHPAGLLYGTVPAHPFLWSASDVAAGHFRRYDRSAIVALLGAKFELLFFSYFFSVLIAPLLLFKVLPFRTGFGRSQVRSQAAEHGVQGGPLVALMRWLLAHELKVIMRGAQVPIGTSCLFVARAKSG